MTENPYRSPESEQPKDDFEPPDKFGRILILLCLPLMISVVIILWIRFVFVGLGFVLWLAALLSGPVLLCLPAWWYSRRRGGESVWLLFVALPAMLVWFCLSAL